MCKFSLAFVALTLPLFATAALQLPPDPAAQPELDEEEVEFIRLINEYRAAHGLGCLAPSPTLNAASDYMSRAMGEQGFFSHNEPPCDATGRNCTGRDAVGRILDYGHQGARTMGENIAAGMPDAATAFESWRKSPPHDANMRNPAYRAIGVARFHVPGSAWGWYWTNTFSDLVDGPWACTPPFDPVEDPVDPPADGGAEGEDGGGCAHAGGGLGGLGLVVTLAGLAQIRRSSNSRSSRKGSTSSSSTPASLRHSTVTEGSSRPLP